MKWTKNLWPDAENSSRQRSPPRCMAPTPGTPVEAQAGPVTAGCGQRGQVQPQPHLLTASARKEDEGHRQAQAQPHVPQWQAALEEQAKCGMYLQHLPT